MKHVRQFVPVVLTLLLAACSSTNPPVTNEPGLAPVIQSFTASPPTIANAGDAATLNWSISGTYSNLQLTDSVSSNAINVSGTSYTVNPSATTTYRLTASGSSGVATEVTTVALQGTDPTPQPTPQPTPTPDPVEPGTPAKPTINDFKASPLTIQPGSSAVLTWNVSGATSLKIDNGVGTVTGTSKSVSPSETTNYKLTATNAGGSVSKNATVTVSTPEQPQTFRGRWLVTFNGGSDDTTFVHELDVANVIDTGSQAGGDGPEVFCHSGLRGALCGTYTSSSGYGSILKDKTSGVITMGFEESAEDGYVLRAGNLTLTTGSNGRQYLDGQANYSPYEGETYNGTVHAENVDEPRTLK